MMSPGAVRRPLQTLSLVTLLLTIRALEQRRPPQGSLDQKESVYGSGLWMRMTFKI